MKRITYVRCGSGEVIVENTDGVELVYGGVPFSNRRWSTTETVLARLREENPGVEFVERSEPSGPKT